VATQAKKNGNGHRETLGRRLAALRKAAGYSQREFALEIGISHRMVAYYEAQTEHPPAHLLPTIAKALHLTTDQVLGLEPVQKRQPPLNQQLLRKDEEDRAAPAPRSTATTADDRRLPQGRGETLSAFESNRNLPSNLLI
jgi:transcriptional regulator with XRE-family HTH domain